jgi:hypothetical protein
VRHRAAILAAAVVGAGLTGCSASQPTVASPARTSSPQSSSHVGIDPEQSPLSGAVPAYKPSTVELAGDGTYQLENMKWQVWSISEAIGTGTAGIDNCSPSCANGHWYHVPVRAVFSRPVHDCTANPDGTTVAGGRYWWSRADLTYPSGLPAALSGPNSPYGQWVFAGLITSAKQSCTS